MTSSNRRQFVFLTASAIAGLHFEHSFSQTPEISLRRADVERGLRDGLNFREQDLEVLTLLKSYSDRQVMIGGGVLTFAAEQPTEWIHLIVRLDRIEEFVRTMQSEELPWGGAIVSTGNNLSFEYKGQRYYIENLMEDEFKERLVGLTVPGTEVNGFRLEFAHDAVVYELQSKAFGDTFNALGSEAEVEMKRIAPAQGVSSALRVMTEEKSLGMEVSRTEEKMAKAVLDGQGLRNQKPDEAASELLAGLSRFSEYNDEYETRKLMTSGLAEGTLERSLGDDVRKISSTANILQRRTDNELKPGAIWHMAMQAREQTSSPERDIQQEMTLKSSGGYNDFYAKRDLSTSARSFAENERAYDEVEKADANEQKKKEVDNAPRIDEIPEPEPEQEYVVTYEFEPKIEEEETETETGEKKKKKKKKGNKREKRDDVEVIVEDKPEPALLDPIEKLIQQPRRMPQRGRIIEKSKDLIKETLPEGITGKGRNSKRTLTDSLKIVEEFAEKMGGL